MRAPLAKSYKRTCGATPESLKKATRHPSGARKRGLVLGSSASRREVPEALGPSVRWGDDEN